MVSRYYQLMRRKYPLSFERETLYQKLEEKTGNTPLIQIKGIRVPNGNEIYAKLEYANPTGSHFDRIYVSLLRRAESKGLIVPRITPLIEVTSGNAGAAFAFAAKQLELGQPTIVMPEDSHPARVKQLESLGGRVVFSPAGKYILGAIEKAKQLVRENHSEKSERDNSEQKMFWVSKVMPEGQKLYHAIVDEAFSQAREKGVNSFDFFTGVAATGTTISGIGSRLLHYNPHAKIVAVDHKSTKALAHLLSTGTPKPAGEQKIFGFTPLGTPLEKLSIEGKVLESIRKNGVLHVSPEDLRHSRNLARKHLNLDIGVTGQAALAAALAISKKVKRKKILILFSNEGWKDSDTYPHEQK